MDSDQLWKDLELESLLRHPELIPNRVLPQDLLHKDVLRSDKGTSHREIGKSKVSSSKLHLMHERTWQKPSYSVLKERYSSQPHQPAFYHPKHIERLADPVIGKYSNYEEVPREHNRKKKDWDNNTAVSTSKRGIFLTSSEPFMPHEEVSVRESRFVKNMRQNITNISKSYTKTSWKDQMRSQNQPMSRTSTNNKKNPSIHNVKFRDQTKRYPIHDSHAKKSLENVRSSGYSNGIKSRSNLTVKEKMIKKGMPETLIPDPLLRQSKPSFYSNINEGVLARKARDMPPYRRVDHREHPPATSYQPRTFVQIPPKRMISKSAPVLLSTDSSNQRNIRGSKPDRLKASIREANRLNHYPAQSSNDNPRSRAMQLLPERSTQDIMNTLKRIEKNEANRFDAMNEDTVHPNKSLTSQLARYAERIDSHLTAANKYTTSYRNVVIEDLEPRIRTPNTATVDQQTTAPITTQHALSTAGSMESSISDTEIYSTLNKLMALPQREASSRLFHGNSSPLKEKPATPTAAATADKEMVEVEDQEPIQSNDIASSALAEDKTESAEPESAEDNYDEDFEDE
jgi:hypothetical protein